MTTDERDDAFGELRHLLACDNPMCNSGSTNATKRCARCHSMYYCSVECQRMHWKKHGHRQECSCVEERRTEWLAEYAVPTAPTTDAWSVEKAVERAELFIKRGRFFLIDPDDVEEQNEMYRLAKVEIDSILAADALNTNAPVMQAHLLETVDPAEAIKQYKGMLRLIRSSRSNSRGLHKGLWPIQIGMARAYEAAGRYDNAMAEYQKVFSSAEGIPDYELDDGDNAILSQLHTGMSRTFYHLGAYEPAIMVVEHLLDENRDLAGLHKLVALPLAALAETRGGKATVTTTMGKTFRGTYAAAMEVMYKGLVYEEQWNHKNKKANRVLLQELSNKAVAAAARAANRA